MPESGTKRDKERAFGMVFALLSITVGNFSGRTSLAVIGGVIGIVWYAVATYHLSSDTEQDGGLDE